MSLRAAAPRRPGPPGSRARVGFPAMTTMWGAPLHKRWRGSRLRDPRQARFLTPASLRWVLKNRAYTPWYLVRYWRFLEVKPTKPPTNTPRAGFLCQGGGGPA